MIPDRVPYAGIASRAIALGIDGLVSHGIYIVGAALIGLAASIVGELRPEWLVGTLAALGWALTVATYFTGFWVVTGQTPGMRVMGLRVERAGGGLLRVGQALVRARRPDRVDHPALRGLPPGALRRPPPRPRGHARPQRRGLRRGRGGGARVAPVIVR